MEGIPGRGKSVSQGVEVGDCLMVERIRYWYSTHEARRKGEDAKSVIRDQIMNKFYIVRRQSDIINCNTTK